MMPTRVAFGDLERSGARAVLGLCAMAVGVSAILFWFGSNAFTPYFGAANPILVTVFVSLAGVVSLGVLQRSSWFPFRGEGHRGLLVGALLGVVLTIPVLLVDVLGGFGSGINVLPPESFLFYPSIAVVAEFVFHVVPLAVLAGLAIRLGLGRDPARLYCIVAVSLIEPVAQVVWGSAYSPAWANTYVGVQLLAFNLIGLHLFKRHGFLAMYMMRVAYYLIWHIVWGSVRLDVLFAGVGTP